jgi:hypothetical protein
MDKISDEATMLSQVDFVVNEITESTADIPYS